MNKKAIITLPNGKGVFDIEGLNPGVSTELKLFPLGTMLEYEGHKYRYCYNKGKDAIDDTMGRFN